MRDTEKQFREIVSSTLSLDYILISSPENFYYISGYSSHQHTVSRMANMACILMNFNPKNIFTKLMVMDYEYQNVLKYLKDEDYQVVSYDTWVGVKSEEEISENKTLVKNAKKTIFNHIINEMDLSENIKIGIEKDFVPINFFTQLQALLPNAEFIDISSHLVKSRSVKTKEEILIFKELINIQDNALLKVMNNLKIGITEKELSEIYINDVMKNTNVFPSSWSMFSIGENASILGLPSEKILTDGDVFKYDGGVNKPFEFYTTDFARSWIVGTKNPMLVELKEKLFEAQRLMISNMKPGVKIKDIFNIGFECVKTKYPQYERGHLGHSISLGPSTWEAPLITSSEERILEKGMILCVEVPLYIKKLGGFNIEDMVLITEDGAEILSNLTPHFGAGYIF
ncbi:MAG: M24 family metallopeptidase [Cetobacterium sp.]